MALFTQNFQTTLAADRDRWILWAPVLLAIGIGTYFSLVNEPTLGLGIALLVSIYAAYWLVSRIGISTDNQWAMYAAIALGLAALGFTAAQLRTLSVEAPALPKTQSSATVSGHVVQIEHYSTGARITIEKPEISRIANHQTPDLIRLRLRGSQPKIEPGDWISARARLSPPGAPAVPGGFDFQRHSFFQKIGAYGFSFGPVTVTAHADETQRFSLRLWLSRIRNSITSRIISGLASPYGGLAAALMTGEKHAVPEPIVENLRASGLAHLLSISGLHIGLVAGIVFSGVRFLLVLVPGLAVRYPIKKVAAVAAILAAFLYALLAGATLPTQRAFIMAAIALVAVILDRRGISLRSVAWAAFVVLLFQPESLLGPSFQMSFAAATALVAFYEVWTTRRRQNLTSAYNSGAISTIGRYLAGVSLTTLVASAATTPFAWYHFNQFADFSLFANLLAIPITALWVMPWAVISLIAMPFGLETWALIPMGWGLNGVVSIAQTVANWPGAVTRLAALPTWGLTIITLSGLWLFIWQQKWRLMAIPALAIGFLSIFVTQHPDLIIDGQARIFAIKTDDGKLMVSSLRRATRDRELWLRHLGIQNAALIPDYSDHKDKRLPIHCDTSGCLFTKDQTKIAIALTESALIEDCWSADIVIALVPIRSTCPAQTVIDRFDLWQNGTYALSITEGQVKIQTTNTGRGNRPWVLKRQRSQPTPTKPPKT